MNDFISKVQQLEAPLLHLWKKEKDKSKVALETSAILASYSLDKFFNEEQILQDVFNKGIQSYYPAGSFSDFNCSLLNNDFFRLELYFWDRLDTGIHSHPFYGSFQCLKGEVVVQDYQFKADEVLNGTREVSVGELILSNSQKIAGGSVYTIYQGQDHIHKTIHTCPTVNLCVRSFTDNTIRNYNFLYPDFRIEKKALTAEDEKMLELYNYVWDKDEHDKLRASILGHFDLAAVIHFFIKGSQLLELHMRREPAEFFLNECRNKILEHKNFSKVVETLKKNQVFMDKLNFGLKRN